MADYPAAVPALADEVGEPADPLNAPSLPAWATHISQEVEALAAELGTHPSAAFATVTARLDNVDTELADRDALGSAAAAQAAAIAAASSDATAKANAAQAAAVQRANHTGTQLAATISDFDAAAIDAVDGTYVALAPAPTGVDDTIVLQGLIDALPTGIASEIVLRPGTYLISSALTISRTATAIRGAGRRRTFIKQTTAAAHGITLSMDAVDGLSTKGLRFIDFTLEGPGLATSTGKGINGSSAPAYNGQHIYFHGFEAREWQVGVELNMWDNIEGTLVHLDRCQTGWYHYGNGNSIHLQASGTGCTTTVIRCGNGANCVLRPLDLISSVQMITIDADLNNRVTIIGGNYESCSGSQAFIKAGANASVTLIGPKFLKGVGNDVPGVYIDGTTLTIANPLYAGFATNKVVYKSTVGAIVHFLGASSSLSAAPMLVDDGGTVAAPGGPFVTRPDNSIPSAGVNLRGIPVYKTVRDSVTDQDELYFYLKDRVSGSDAYSRRTLTNTITGTGSPEGSVAARIGTLYARTDGGAATSLYLKESGTGNTGWTAVPTSAAALLALLLTVDGAGSGLDADLLDGVSSSGFTLIGASAYWKPWQSGRYYFLPNIVGTTTTAAWTNNTCRWWPIWVPNAITLSRIGGEITAAGDAGSTFRLGIYNDDGTGRPGTKVLDAGTIAGDSATVQEITISQALTPGAYWIAAALQGATVSQPTIRLANLTGLLPNVEIGTSAPAANANRTGWSQNGVSGALPADASSASAGNVLIARVFGKVA